MPGVPRAEEAMNSLLAIQVLTFVALGAMFIRDGQVKLGLAQLGLAGIQWLIYS